MDNSACTKRNTLGMLAGFETVASMKKFDACAHAMLYQFSIVTYRDCSIAREMVFKQVLSPLLGNDDIITELA